MITKIIIESAKKCKKQENCCDCDNDCIYELIEGIIENGERIDLAQTIIDIYKEGMKNEKSK